jgi:hypothetical protein
MTVARCLLLDKLGRGSLFSRRAIQGLKEKFSVKTGQKTSSEIKGSRILVSLIVGINGTHLITHCP